MALAMRQRIQGDTQRELARLTAAALNGLVEQDVQQLIISKSKNEAVKPLYAAGVRYLREEIPREEWWSIWDVLERGGGICEDFACWRVAELRGANVEARPLVYYPENGSRMLHALVAVLATPANVQRWRELTTQQLKAATLSGPTPRLSTTTEQLRGERWHTEDPSKALGM